MGVILTPPTFAMPFPGYTPPPPDGMKLNAPLLSSQFSVPKPSPAELPGLNACTLSPHARRALVAQGPPSEPALRAQLAKFCLAGHSCTSLRNTQTLMPSLRGVLTEHHSGIRKNKSFRVKIYCSITQDFKRLNGAIPPVSHLPRVILISTFTLQFAYLTRRLSPLGLEAAAVRRQKPAQHSAFHSRPLRNRREEGVQFALCHEPQRISVSFTNNTILLSPKTRLLPCFSFKAFVLSAWFH
ncbi:hypothetical protein SKAU_G00230170 [Synaphobranchus kaupii]|uniref:Uncharacterized protein n=1 Tax=Synaphobranchus kaupii TaxID=118154 RepID=A0A9Q1F5H1_SYNKA|nr:hypothetical protein SKAU_G00230170 [Synaphobranchus kaupii]